MREKQPPLKPLKRFTSEIMWLEMYLLSALCICYDNHLQAVIHTYKIRVITLKRKPRQATEIKEMCFMWHRIQFRLERIVQHFEKVAH